MPALAWCRARHEHQCTSHSLSSRAIESSVSLSVGLGLMVTILDALDSMTVQTTSITAGLMGVGRRKCGYLLPGAPVARCPRRLRWISCAEAPRVRTWPDFGLGVKTMRYCTIRAMRPIRQRTWSAGKFNDARLCPGRDERRRKN